jgi:hypothetical protein
VISWSIVGVVIVSAIAVIAVYFILVNMDRILIATGRRTTQKRRQRGPWCVVRNRAPYGLQIIFQARSKGMAVSWRAKHRGEFEDTLFLLTSRDVGQVNAAAMSQDAFWDMIDDFAPIPLPSRTEVLALPIKEETP